MSGDTKVLLLGLNYAPEPVGTALYTTGLAEGLAATGHVVQVIAAVPHYPGWRLQYAAGLGRNTENGVDVTRLPLYVPDRPTAMRRLLYHLSFFLIALLPVLLRALTFRPHAIIAIAPALALAPLALLAARLCGARAILHVQDFEVDAAIATGLLKGTSRFAAFAFLVERVLLASFDAVSTISPQMCRLLVDKGVAPENIAEIRNWADTDLIRPLTGPSPFRGSWKVTTPHVALYSGSIASKQGMGLIVEVARTLQHRADLTFIICGEGPNRAAIEALATGLSNIQFHALQSRERLGDLLGLASVHLLPQLGAAADYLLPSKLGNMLASGRPVVAAAAPGTGLAEAVKGCGLAVPPEDVAAFARALERLLDSPKLHARCALAARQRAGFWTRQRAVKAFAELLVSIPQAERA